MNDHEEPLTEEWLTDNFKVWLGWGGRRGWEIHTVCIIRHNDSGFFPVFSHTGQGPAGAQLKTRGDVDRLCIVFGTKVRGRAAK